MPWSSTPPTEPGYYWIRYVAADGGRREPTVMELISFDIAFTFGDSSTFDPSVTNRRTLVFEYGPRISPPKD